MARGKKTTKGASRGGSYDKGRETNRPRTQNQSGGEKGPSVLRGSQMIVWLFCSDPTEAM